MISSEVQRTLVKSPPELWAEISDPESLARHLGELGEIRITRSKPEELVEWESDSASGTISIKASGWGTRVTLTAARELPLDLEADAAGGAEGAGGAEAASDFEPTTPTSVLGAQMTPELAPQAETDALEAIHLDHLATAPDHLAAAHPDHLAAAHPDHLAAAPPDIAAALEPTVELVGHEAATDETPVPPVTAAGALSAWTRHEAELAEPVELGEPEPLDETAFDDEPLDEAAFDDERLDEAALDEAALGETAEPEEPRLARRGLFARLFGRFSRTKGTPAGASDVAPEVELHIAREAARRRLEATLAMVELTTEPGYEESYDGATPAEADEEHFDTALPATDEERFAAALASADESAAGLGPEPAATASAAPQEPSEPLHDLAAELREAEETAAEEVRAVLTAVLDRLGAAHHRPFSRG